MRTFPFLLSPESSVVSLPPVASSYHQTEHLSFPRYPAHQHGGESVHIYMYMYMLNHNCEQLREECYQGAKEKSVHDRGNAIPGGYWVLGDILRSDNSVTYMYTWYTCTCTLYVHVIRLLLVTPVQLMRPGIGRNRSVHWVTSFITSRPVCVYSCSQPAYWAALVAWWLERQLVSWRLRVRIPFNAVPWKMADSAPLTLPCFDQWITYM